MCVASAAHFLFSFEGGKGNEKDSVDFFAGFVIVSALFCRVRSVILKSADDREAQARADG